MPTDTRQRILRALRTMLARGGTSSVTLEAVAAEAGVSKGGLLYHFPTKAAMYEGLLADVRDAVARETAAAVERHGAARGFLEYTEPSEDDEVGFFTSLLAAVRTGQSGDSAASNERATALLAETFQAWEQPMLDAIEDPVQAQLIRLVGFGLYFAALAGLPPLDSALREQVFQRALEAAGQGPVTEQSS